MPAEAGAFRLDGRVALVTGASRGIGRATALELARAGANVALVARDAGLLAEVEGAVGTLGRRAVVCVADVADPAQVRGAVDRCRVVLGPVDVLVNNAGVTSRGAVEEVDDATWATLMAVNLTAAFGFCRAVSREMRARGWGRIVNVASISAQTGGVSGSAAYSAAKGGLVSMTKTLARDLGPAGVTVNAVAPGQIDTAMGRLPTAADQAALTAQIPLGRLGNPDDIAHAVRFLASEEAGYITGATLDVNGGILRR